MKFYMVCMGYMYIYMEYKISIQMRKPRLEELNYLSKIEQVVQSQT